MGFSKPLSQPSGPSLLLYQGRYPVGICPSRILTLIVITANVFHRSLDGGMDGALQIRHVAKVTGFVSSPSRLSAVSPAGQISKTFRKRHKPNQGRILGTVIILNQIEV